MQQEHFSGLLLLTLAVKVLTTPVVFCWLWGCHYGNNELPSMQLASKEK